MVLYMCPSEKKHASMPGPLAHPCGRAAKALDRAGHSYESKIVPGGMMQPWTWRSRSSDRAEVRELSGRNGVPILVLDDGEVIAGSGNIVQWAAANPAESAVA